MSFEFPHMRITTNRYISFILYLILVNGSSVFGNDGFVFEEYKSNTGRLFHSDTIVYYGLDFTKAIYTFPDKVGEEKANQKFFAAWISYFEALIRPEDILVKLLKKNQASRFNPISIQYNYTNISPPWISEKCFSLTIDSLSRHIKAYSIRETSGIGFVINVENLNMSHKYVSAYFTFFDISTKDILWTVKVKGTPGGSGYSTFWAIGIYNALKEYIDRYYKQESLSFR